MSLVNLADPRFRRGDRVQFAGGSGKIRNCQLESGVWVYVVEIGAEASETLWGNPTVLLSETELD